MKSGITIKPGMVSKGIRRIKKPDWKTISVNGRSKLVVCENGLVRTLPISNQVAEVLIASGVSYGS